MTKSIMLALGILLALTSRAQEQPRLVVGVVIDQMRMDYIYRYWDHYSEDGFKRLIRQGFLCKNAHFNFIPTYTAPGHASIYSGAAPMNHGIIANNWFDKRSERMVSCVADTSCHAIGSENSSGAASPRLMLAPTLGDAIKISNLFRGKSIGIALKDRGAIMCAGFSADAAYWMDYSSGAFVTSSYYMEALPKWVEDFNRNKHADRLSKDGWQPLLAIEKYDQSTADDTPYEMKFTGSEAPVFPYDLPSIIKQDGYYAFGTTPFGNTIVRMMAERAIVEEDLGGDEHLDLLAISFSSPDLIGHAFGPQSIEVEDTYIRLDEEIARLLKTLDEKVGEKEYTLFLTADHAAAHVPNYLKDNGVPVGYFDEAEFLTNLSRYLEEHLGQGEWIHNYSNQQLFLNHALLSQRQVEVNTIYGLISRFAMDYEGVASLLSAKQLKNPLPDDRFATMARMGWNPLRSGDIVIQYLPGWMYLGPEGTTHGSSYNYDSHVPLLFYGKGIRQGVSVHPVDITQIAPTMSIVSSIAFPMLSDTRPVEEAIAD